MLGDCSPSLETWVELTIGGDINKDVLSALRKALQSDARTYQERIALEDMLESAIMGGPFVLSGKDRDGFSALEECCEQHKLPYRLRAGCGPEFAECTLSNEEKTLTYVEMATGVLAYCEDLCHARDEGTLNALVDALSTARDTKIRATFDPELADSIIPF